MTRDRLISLAILIVWGVLLVPAFNLVVVPLIYKALMASERTGGPPTMEVTAIIYWGIIGLALAVWVLTYALVLRWTLRRIRS